MAKLVFVESEGIGGVESADAKPAQRAAALIIEREMIAERRPALDAEVVGRERLGLGETRSTNRCAGNLAERLAAQAALIGEEQGKDGFGKFSGEGRRELG